MSVPFARFMETRELTIIKADVGTEIHSEFRLDSTFDINNK